MGFPVIKAPMQLPLWKLKAKYNGWKSISVLQHRAIPNNRLFLSVVELWFLKCVCAHRL